MCYYPYSEENGRRTDVLFLHRWSVSLFAHVLNIFSHDMAHISNEPSHERTNNLGFRPDLSQTGLCSHKRGIEARFFFYLGSRDYIYHPCGENKGAISAEASSKYLARKAISFHPLHIKGLMVSCWRTFNGQTFRPGCQVRMWILHAEIQDGVQNGRQKDDFSIFSPKGVKTKKSMQIFVLFYSKVTYKA